MYKNKTFTVKITDLTNDGAGIGRIEELNNLAVFTDGALPGDICEIKIKKANKNYAYGELIKLIEPSADRIKPVCRVSEKCGGCALQSLSYKAQLKLKRGIVINCLERIGGIKNARVHEIIGMDEPYNYRNKAQLPVKKNKRDPNKTDIGFYSRRTHDVINIYSCAITFGEIKEIMQVFRDYFEKNKNIVYDESKHTGIIRHIFIRSGYKTGEIIVCITANLKQNENLPDDISLINGFKKIAGLAGIILNINNERTNVILGKTNKILYGRGYIFDYIMDKKFKISVNSFYQVNPAQTEKLYAGALELAQVSKDFTCIDAYCGIGTIALIFAPFVKKVYGVEIIEQAVADARENAEINNITNAEFIEGKSEQIIPELVKLEKIDLIIFDPPRKGCDIKLLEAVISAEIKNLIYISCDPATLARDIKILTAGGYKLHGVQPVDMFPHTMHVEAIVLMQRQDT